MSNQEDEFLKSLRATFKVEADEHLQAMSAGLIALEKSAAPEERRQIVETIFRAAHSLKGAARAVNFTDIEAICQLVEDKFATWRREQILPTPQALDSVYRELDEVSRLMSDPGSNETGRASQVTEPSLQVAFTSESATAERTTSGDTVRISVAKLDARLLEAEEMLVAKLAASQRAIDLRELSGQVERWMKAWTGIQPEVRAIRQAIERQGDAPVSPAGLNRLVEFFESSHDYVRSLESKIVGLSRTAEQDRAVVGKLVDDLLEDSKKLLMLPVGTLGGFFPKMVRDLCRDQGKEADFVIRGEEVEIDKRILEEMKDPLTHLLRNCVDHGIESPDVRRQSGKPPRATITLLVSSVNGSKVELLISDDGAGIDIAKVRESAIKHGFISREEAERLSDGEAMELIFRSEVSTSPTVTQLSGRGLGLAIVREKAERLGGHVFAESRRGKGTTIRIALPIALATFRGILIETADRLFVVPTSNVERVTRFKSDEVRTVESRETISLNGGVIALVRLSEVLELPLKKPDGDAVASTPVVVLEAGEQRAAFAVDAVLDEQEVLVKQIGKPLSRVRNISGATILGSGRIAPILNVSDLLKSARTRGGAPRVFAKPKAEAVVKKSILVVEDSITSRLLLKGILESAGYQVTTAVDGVEAITTLRVNRFDLVISDVEMPRLNGFDLTARIRSDRKLAELPVVLVTALETREDRERGIDVGANAYLVKSSFDQSNLLEAVRRLI